MTEIAASEDYDQVPYPSQSYALTHPDHLATVATLLGVGPPPVERCRVLELGCAGGGNIIPMAYRLPESEFVGIDLSAGQIAHGWATAAALGLKNIAFKQMDILEVDADLGSFDYIIAHGVFSWVPRPVQDKILDICRENLVSNGVAYVSYNTYPGWHLLRMIRDLMLYHTRSLTDPWERATQARAFLDFLAEAIPATSGGYGSFLNMYAKFLRGELEDVDPKSDAFLLHDELSEVNEPVYFHQFAERLASHGLQYLGDSEFRTMVDSNFAPEVSEKLRQMAQSVVDLEQYMDFLRNRTFRRTLLCHQDIPLDRTLRLERLKAFYVASRAQPVASEPDITSVTVEKFRATDGAVLSTDHPVSKAAMLHLAEIWPHAVPLEAVSAAARSRLGLDGTPEPEDTRVLATNLLTGYCYSPNLVELHVYDPALVAEVNERPVACPLVRFQAQGGTKVTNLRHQRVVLDELERFLLLRLDGSHDRAALVEALKTGPVAEGILVIQQEGEPVKEVEEVDAMLARLVESKLHGLARAALFVE